MTRDGLLRAALRAVPADLQSSSGSPLTEPGLPCFPETAWRAAFADYRAAMADTTEASDVAHFMAMWTASAATLGRSVWMYAGERVYPNVYGCYFGATGDKKTTAQRRPIGLNLITRRVKIIQASGSTEGIADALTRTDGGPAEAFFHLEELTSLLAKGRWEGSTILQFFTEAFDCPDVWELKYRHGKVSISLPTLTISAGTTSEWFWQNARPIDFYGGFGNRFVYLTGPKKDPIPNPREPHPQHLQAVRDVLGRLASLPPTEARFDSQAERMWAQFYTSWEAKQRTGLYAAAVKRIHVHVRKLAMTYAAMEETLPNINVEQLKAAIAVGLYASECARVLVDVRHSCGDRGASEMERRFLEWLERNNGAKKRYMQQTFSKVCSCEVFNRTLANLIKADRLVVQDGHVFLSR